ncbi:MAG: hypothetical protein DRQ24_09235 [Candidatus Latescibacterota bacterium]|nr:MAG: hypothetical protein DRQ24_09235 [Candidatus Latescibacterota bacterium]
MKQIHFKCGQLCRWNPARGFELDGKPIHIVGTNYVARYICTNFWEDWRREAIEADLAEISATGLNAVRIPVHWEYFEPAPGQYREEALERFGKFLDMAAAHGLFVMPWFLVGVATEDYDVSWRDGRSFFREPMATYAANHLANIVRRFRDRPNILCWDICDEPEWYSRCPGADPLPYDSAMFTSWVRRMVEAIRAEDPKHSIMLGFGHIASAGYGMNIRDMAELLDCMGVTAYPLWCDTEFLHDLRNNYFVSWSGRFNDCAGKGYFCCEAPGFSSVWASEESIGEYFRVVLYSDLINGSRGVLPWVWNDFEREIWHIGALNLHPAEPSFGLRRLDGSLKPSGQELRSFARFVRQVGIEEWEPVRATADVVIPEVYAQNTKELFSPVYHSFLACRQAGLHVRYLWERDLEKETNQMLIIPGIGGYLTHSWQLIVQKIQDGATLYLGVGRNQFSPLFNSLFGVEVEGWELLGQDLVARRTEGICDELMPEEMSLPAGQSLLCVNPKGAQVEFIASGRPALLHYRFGKGHTWLLAYPMEASLAQLSSQELAEHPLHRIYRAIATSDGSQIPVWSTDPRVEVGVWKHPDGRWLVIAVNHTPVSVTTCLMSVKRWGSIVPCIGDKVPRVLDENRLELSLGPCEVVGLIYEVR